MQEQGISTTVSAVKHYTNRRQWPREGTQYTAERVQEDSQRRDVSLEHHELKMLYKKALDQLNLQEKVLDCCKRSIQSLPPVNKIPTKFSEGTREASDLIAVAPLSDTHGGEVVRLAETGGLAAYDMTIFNRRLALWVNRILLLTDIRRSADKVSTLYVPELGDMISGDIHDELARTNTDASMQITVSVAYCISQALAKLAAHFDAVEVSGVVGNHGRMTKEKTYKKGAVMNWDYLCYQLQTLFLAKQQNIHFIIPESFWHVLEIGSWRILTFHGGSIQSYNSIPFYGIDRAVAKFREMLYSGHQYFDDVLLGHFHTDAQIGRARGSVYISGSMRGGDEYAMARLQAYSPPTQMLLFYHPDHGCVSKETLFLQPTDTREDLGFEMMTLDSWQHLIVN
uniref:Calcineurin-like phosphoesterase domain-containing protein n=1 Tax=viral metagenome TaxID=1070528 RepID=A0A6M3L0H2_9ZZZZ